MDTTFLPSTPNLSLRPAQFATLCLVSLAQIMLQGSPITGGLFLLAVLLESPIMAVMMTTAVVSANITAWILKFNNAHLNQGLYGFSAALVGLFVAVFFGITTASLILTVIGAILAMLIQAIGLYYRLPLYTLPFIVVSWGLYILATWLNIPTTTLATVSWSITVSLPITSLPILTWIDGGIIKATGQVMFLGSTLAGLLCLIGLGLNNFRQNHGKTALLALIAAGAGYAVAYVFGADNGELALGLWGYNSVLIISALADKKPWWWLIGVILGVSIQWLFDNFLDFGIMGGFLTLPFVLATWAVLAGFWISKQVKLNKQVK